MAEPSMRSMRATVVAGTVLVVVTLAAVTALVAALQTAEPRLRGSSNGGSRPAQQRRVGSALLT